MNTKTKAATKTAAASASSAPAVKKAPRKPKQPSLSLAQKFELLSFVKAADPTATDSAVAEAASVHFGRKVLKVSVAQYRKEFGIASVPNAKPAQVLAYVETLKALLTANGIEVPPLATGAEPAERFTDDPQS
jgi:transposase